MDTQTRGVQPQGRLEKEGVTPSCRPSCRSSTSARTWSPRRGAGRHLAQSGRSSRSCSWTTGAATAHRKCSTAWRGKRRGPRVLHLRATTGRPPRSTPVSRPRGARIVVTLDADLQNDPADIPRLLAALEGGIRSRRGLSREARTIRSCGALSSLIANAVRNRLSGDDIIDTGCSLKAFRRERLAGLKLFTGMHRFLPTLLRIEGFAWCRCPSITGRAGRGPASTACGTGSSGPSPICWWCAG